jgi:hypothetical protein
MVMVTYPALEVFTHPAGGDVARAVANSVSAGVKDAIAVAANTQEAAVPDTKVFDTPRAIVPPDVPVTAVVMLMTPPVRMALAGRAAWRRVMVEIAPPLTEKS